MSSTVAKSVAPSNGDLASSGKKRKRNRRRRTGAGDAAGDGSDSEKEDVGKGKSGQSEAVDVGQPAASSSKAPGSEAPAHQTTSTADEEQKDDSRKRKRKRNRGGAARGEAEQEGEGEAQQKVESKGPQTKGGTDTAPTVSVVQAVPLDQCPDPEGDESLSEQAQKALAYARQYALDRSNWKFQKARQNWLVRHALSHPPTSSDDAAVTIVSANDENKEANGDAAEEESAFIPDAYVPVLGHYLASMLGGAKERLIGTLRTALEAPAIKVLESQPASSGVDNGVTDGATQPQGQQQASTSFGAMAMAADEAIKTEGTGAGTGSAADAAKVEARRTRARELLSRMGERV